MKSCVYVEYTTHDGQPVWGPFLAERLEYTFQLGSQGPGTMSHFTPIIFPGLTRDIVAPKRSDYRVKWTADDGQTFVDVQGGFSWDIGLATDDPIGPNFSGVDWSAWLDNPIAQDRELTFQDLVDDARAGGTLLLDMHWGLPGSPYNWLNSGLGVNQRVIIEDLIESANDGPDGISFSVSFGGSHWINVPGIVAGRRHGLPFQIDPWDTQSIRQHINNICTLNDPWVPNYRCEADKSIDFFFMKNKDPAGDITPDFAAHDESVIHHIDWTEHGPIATYVTGWGIGGQPKWFTTTHAASEEKFRRWRSNHMIGSRGQVYLTQEQIEEGTKAFADKYPQKDLAMTIYPDKLDPINQEAGFHNLCGYVLDVDYDFTPFHRIDAVFYIISQRFHTDAAGNWLCDLGLQQIYS